MGAVFKNKRQPAFFYLFTFFVFQLLLSCGSPSDRFRLEGKFKNLNQGDFYIYSLEDGSKDTIHVQDGRFVYDIAMHDTTTLMLLFPNYSELPIFARPSAEVEMKGDASHLKETEVKGTEENEEMTGFRLRANQLMPPEVVKAAEEHIKEEPASPVSFYLMQRYFILNQQPDYAKADELCKLMLEATPNDIRLKRLQAELQQLKAGTNMKRVPSFSAKDTKGNNITNSDLQKEVNVIYVWASWNYDSQNTGRQLRRKQKENPSRLAIMSICLDPSPKQGQPTLDRDSITWSNVCDGQMWNTPLLKKLGIATLPANIISDKSGKVLARNLSGVELSKKLDELLK